MDSLAFCFSFFPSTTFRCDFCFHFCREFRFHLTANDLVSLTSALDWNPHLDATHSGSRVELHSVALEEIGRAGCFRGFMPGRRQPLGNLAAGDVKFRDVFAVRKYQILSCWDV